MKNLKLFDGSNIEVHDIIYEQMMGQWYNANECIEEANVSYNFYDGGNFFDVGAFNGIYSYILAPKAKKDTFVSFEPDNRFIEFIQFALKNLQIKYNNIDCKIITTPVGDGNLVNFNLPNRGPNGEIGHPCFFGSKDSNNSTSKTITIDSFIKETSIYPSLIKIDVEGAEKNVLSGMEELLNSHNKPKIILELHENYLLNNFNINPIDVINYLKYYGYKYKEFQFGSKKEKILLFE